MIDLVYCNDRGIQETWCSESFLLICIGCQYMNAGPQIGAGLDQDHLRVEYFRPATNDRQVQLRDEDMETSTEERGSSGGCSLPTKVLVEVLDEHRDARGEEIDIIMKALRNNDTILWRPFIEHVRGNSDEQGCKQTDESVAKYDQLFEE
ncbi:hypothetical protein C8R48DRAFT_797795 [Suillus tomentosus]|nr:hypothetical protein C8R48DRAFT_797795 [Suillus tomentosus]